MCVNEKLKVERRRMNGGEREGKIEKDRESEKMQR